MDKRPGTLTAVPLEEDDEDETEDTEDCVSDAIVEDDGVGMAEGRAREVGFVSRGAGIGMRNVRERLEVLYGNSARFEVFSRPGRGTRVTLEIPMAPNVLVLADQTSARASTLS